MGISIWLDQRYTALNEFYVYLFVWDHDKQEKNTINVEISASISTS